MEGKKHIVAVDDSPMVLKVLTRLLSEEFEFTPFSKGMRALQYLQENKPDLLILDIDMPDINGYQLLRQVNNMYNVPVIFLTSNSDRQYVEKAVFYGAKDYALKPIVEDVFLNKVHKLLK